MLENSRVTAFTVFELLRKKQLGLGKITTPPPPPPRLGLRDDSIKRRSVFISEINQALTLYTDS